jgi:hypothetical protein
MLSKIASTGLFIGRQFLQTSSKSSWLGRSVTTLCKGCDARCLNFIEAQKKNALCESAVGDQKVTHRVAITEGTSSRGNVLPWKRIIPLMTYRNRDFSRVKLTALRKLHEVVDSHKCTASKILYKSEHCIDTLTKQCC